MNCVIFLLGIINVALSFFVMAKGDYLIAALNMLIGCLMFLSVWYMED